MAGQFGTQTEVMRGAAQHVFDVRDQIQGELTALRSQLAPLEGAWVGDAARAFQGLMVRWNEDAGRINRALQEIGEAVAASGKDYRSADHEAVQGTSSIRQALG